MAQLDSDIPREVRIIEEYYGDNFGIGNTIIASDVEISTTPSNQSATIQGYIDFIRDTGGVGKIILPPSSKDEPIWIGTKLDIDDLLYLEICGQGAPGLIGGYGTVLRNIALTEDSESRMFDGTTNISGNGVYYFHDLTFWGPAEDFPSFGTENSRFIVIYGAESVTINRIGCYYNRLIAISLALCGHVEISDSRFERCDAPINSSETRRRVIRNNIIRNCGDDAIAIHSQSTQGGNPPKQPSIIEGNIIEDSFGIRINGGTKVIVRGNIIERPKGYGIQSIVTGVEGETDICDILITDNVITNVINSNKWPSSGSSNAGIHLTSDIDSFALPVVGQAIPFVNLPELVSPISGSSGSTNAGGQRIVIANNIIAQTLPQVSTYTDWGFGQSYYFDGGFIDIDSLHSDFHMQTNGVLLSGAFIDVTIRDNIFERVSWGVIASTTFSYMGYIGVIGNKFRRVKDGVAFFNHASVVKHGKLDIRDNEIDCDPFFESTNRDYVNGSTATVTISQADPAVITWTGHALPANTAVRFTTTGALPAGLTASATEGARSYYVRGGATLLTDSFTVAAYPNGPAIATTDAGSGTHTGFSSIPDGTWTNGDGKPYLVEAQDWETFNFTGNRVQSFNNFSVTDADTKTGRVSENIIYMEPGATATVASSAVADNRGVRNPGSLLRNSNTFIHTDCDPTSTTYGQTLTQRATSAYGQTIPTAGFYLTGEIVWNNAATEDTLALTDETLGTGVIGWRRLTTGSAHVLDTDWREILALTGGVT